MSVPSAVIFACVFAMLTWRPSFAHDAVEYQAKGFVAQVPISARERRFTELVLVRAQAIANALGPLLDGACTDVYVELAKPSTASYPENGPAHYDPQRHVLTFRRSLIEALDYDVSHWAKSYWPYYQHAELRSLIPLVEVIDDALWLTHLQEAAHQKDMTWPHAGCSSLRVADRLGCEMLFTAARIAVRSPHGRLFNENRIDLLWPEDLHDLRGRAWRENAVYRDVQRLGGLMLVRPLVAQFGLPRVLRYLAQTPFHIEGDNVRASAVLYQEQARRSLDVSAIN